MLCIDRLIIVRCTYPLCSRSIPTNSTRFFLMTPPIKLWFERKIKV